MGAQRVREISAGPPSSLAARWKILDRHFLVRCVSLCLWPAGIDQKPQPHVLLLLESARYPASCGSEGYCM